MRTRSKPAKATTTAPPIESPPKPLPIPDQNPPKFFILPKTLSKEARIVTLAHPRSLVPTRYYHCPSTGLYEIKRIAAPSSAPRSLLLAPEQSIDGLESAGDENNETADAQSSPPREGYVCQTAAFFTVTAIDSLFLVLPALSPRPKETGSRSEGKVLFQSADDLLENVFELSKHLEYVTRHQATRDMIEGRIIAVCDAVEAGDEKMYRLSSVKLLQELMRKAERMSDGGLPPSMEERFVERALDVPMASILVEEEAVRLRKEGSIAGFGGAELSVTESTDSQSAGSNTSRGESQSSAATDYAAITVPISNNSQSSVSASALQPTEEIKHLLRLRTSLSYLFSSYIPKHLASVLEALLADPETSKVIGFAPLTKHLAALAALRAEAATRSSFQASGDSFKRSYEEDEDAESRAEKKRKKEEEERRKKVNESRGVRDLKKVDVTGMKKMSDFFKTK